MKARFSYILIAIASVIVSGCYVGVRPVGYDYGYVVPAPYHTAPSSVIIHRFGGSYQFVPRPPRHHHPYHNRHLHFGENPGPEGEFDESLFEPVEQWRIE